MMKSDDRDAESRLRYYSEAVHFLRVFADQCHHGKEENHLFKELINKGIANEGGPVGVMLREHALGRDYIARMSRSLDEKNVEGFHVAAKLYRDLLLQHIEKENNVLFMMADKVIDEQEQDLLFERFERHEEDVIRHGVHEELHAMIHTWAEVFGVESKVYDRLPGVDSAARES